MRSYLGLFGTLPLFKCASSHCIRAGEGFPGLVLLEPDHCGPGFSGAEWGRAACSHSQGPFQAMCSLGTMDVISHGQLLTSRSNSFLGGIDIVDV